MLGFAAVTPKPHYLTHLLQQLRSIAAHDLRQQSHLDGWGVTYWTPASLVHYRRTLPITQDPFFQELTEWNVVARLAILHARRRGPKGAPTAIENTHPFVVRPRRNLHLAVAHNGTIYDVDKLPIPSSRLQGSTDSERFAWLIASQFYRFSESTPKREYLVAAVRAAVQLIEAKGCAYTSLTALVADGQRLLALYAIDPQRVRNPAYYQLRFLSDGNAVFVLQDRADVPGASLIAEAENRHLYVIEPPHLYTYCLD